MAFLCFVIQWYFFGSLALQISRAVCGECYQTDRNLIAQLNLLKRRKSAWAPHLNRQITES
jgi:hypothetical protein